MNNQRQNQIPKSLKEINTTVLKKTDLTSIGSWNINPPEDFLTQPHSRQIENRESQRQTVFKLMSSMNTVAPTQSQKFGHSNPRHVSGADLENDPSGDILLRDIPRTFSAFSEDSVMIKLPSPKIDFEAKVLSCWY
jgi:hypothetical protein